ncbi:MAG: hypothetical protein JXR94_18845 [Candidatus Hydrogenedentes bacterium]|nr:hypothetical protein [Candidatus Hydrogenedentota bacterium]
MALSNVIAVLAAALSAAALSAAALSAAEPPDATEPVAAPAPAPEIPAGLTAVRGEGAAPGVGTDATAAAVRNAQATILVQRLGELYGSPDLSPFQDLFEDPAAYFASYKLLRQERNDDASTTVEIEAQLRDTKLRNDVAAALRPHLAHTPRVLILVSESIQGEGVRPLDGGDVALPALAQAFEDAHFEVVGPALLRAQYPDDALIDAAHREPEVAGRLARDQLAGVVILGEAQAVAEPAPPGSSFHANRAALRLRVIRASDGVEIDSLSAEAVVHSIEAWPGGAQAVRDACERLQQRVVASALLAALNEPVPGDVTLTIRGPGLAARVPRLLESLETELGVGEIEQLNASESVVCVRLAYSGAMRDLVQFLTRREYPEFVVRVPRVVGKNLTVAIEDAPPSP